MKKVLTLLLILLTASSSWAQITVPNTLVDGTTITAGPLNTNFTTLASQALNRTTGGIVDGNITMSAGVTIDGVDLSTFLGAQLLCPTGGSVSAPCFSRVADLTTGFYFPGASQIAASLAGTQRLLLDSNGLTIYGLNIINSSGKVPALTSTYFTSVSFDGANLTGTIPAAVLSGRSLADLGTRAVANLSDGANVALLNGTAAFTANQTITGNLNVSGTITGGTVTGTTVNGTTVAAGTLTASGTTTIAALVATTGSFSGLLTTTGGQIAFPATQVPSAGVNTLDDYERGSFTPTIVGSGGESGQVYDKQVGRYIKVGKLVWFTAYVKLSTLGTVTGTVEMGGLPFTSVTVTDMAVSVPVKYEVLGTNWVNVMGSIASNTARVTLVGAAAAGANNTAGLVQSDLAATSGFTISGSYQAAN